MGDITMSTIDVNCMIGLHLRNTKLMLKKLKWLGILFQSTKSFKDCTFHNFFSFFLEIDCENFNFFFNIKGYHSNTAPS